MIMKTHLFLLTVILALAGCASAPTAFERQFANIDTNYVPVLVLKTNVVTVTQTNLVTVPVTNEIGVMTFKTNVIELAVLRTNVTVATNMEPRYSETPNATAKAVADTAGTIFGMALPGTGALATQVVLGAFALFFGWRNRQFAGKNTALNQSLGVLAQTIETGREILAKTPQGKQAADQFTSWMIQHQAATQTITSISEIVKGVVDNEEAKKAADQILQLINQTPPKV